MTAQSRMAVQDDELERRYAGTCLARPETRDKHPVEPTDLASPAVRAIVQAVDAARLGRKRVGIGHVLAALEGLANELVRSQARGLIESQLPIDLDPAAIAEVLRQRGACRRIEVVLRDGVQAAQRSDWKGASAAVERASTVTADSAAVDPVQLAADVWEDFLRREPTRAFVPIDARLDPIVKLARGTILVLGADTNVGKTSLAAQWCDRAQSCGKPAGFVSLEDPADHIAEKLLVAASRRAAVTLQNAHAVRSGDGIEADRRAVHAILETQRHVVGQVRIVDVKDRSLERTLAAIRVLASYGCELVVVDYLTAMRGDQRLKTARERVDHNLNELAAVVKSTNVALVLCSQFSRPADKKRGTPTKWDLKESGNIENAAQSIVTLWRNRDEDDQPVCGRVVKTKSGRGLGREVWWERATDGYLEECEAPMRTDEKPGARTRRGW